MYDHKDVPSLASHDLKCPGFTVIPQRHGRFVAEFCNQCGQRVGVWDMVTKRKRNRFELPPNWQEEE